VWVLEKKMQFESKVWLRNICTNNGLSPTELQFEQLEHYVNLLLDWNKKINLISRKDEENIWTYHILHCISPLFKIKIFKGTKMVDIGTGGGLPGIPLKILRPDISLLCLDATRKKANAVLQMVTELKLNDVEIVWGRAEEIGVQPKYLHKFDIAIARAVAPLNELLSWSMGFFKKINQPKINVKAEKADYLEITSSVLIALKGGDLTKEMEIAKQKFPKLEISAIDLAFAGSEQLIASDKKMLVVYI
jgi:16S rRNA (guanine527-N7)-methyltransferase